MQVYIYKANIYCEDCTFDIDKDVSQRLIADTGDSNNFPQGPYANGGGESDTPQHCATCGLFLENPLTSNGYDYVKQAIHDLASVRHKVTTAELLEYLLTDYYLADMGGDGPVVEQWAHFYNLPLEE